jgi:hypothetical protein
MLLQKKHILRLPLKINVNLDMYANVLFSYEC